MADPTLSDDGVCFELDTMQDRRCAVTPTVTTRFNTIQQPFSPKVCWRIDDHRFDFDSSFLVPTASKDFSLLVAKRPPGPAAPPGSQPLIHEVKSGDYLEKIAHEYGFGSWRDLYYADENADYRASHPDPNKLYPGDTIVIPGQFSDGGEGQVEEDPKGLRLTVFGHADPTGKDAYNRELAGRRARAVYGVLVRDVNMWDDLYKNPHGGDEWSLRHNQIMLEAVGYDPGRTDGQSSAETNAAVRAFQAARGLSQSGYVDVPTRKKLIAAYMDVLCVDGAGQPFRYNRKDFLSHGEGQDGKGDYQSCSEFNPLLVFSQAEEALYEGDKELRDLENVPNRRVAIYMFEPTPKIDCSKWPCPTLKEGDGACRSNFWSDGDARRSPQSVRRDSRQRGKTMACKWYHRLSWLGACEGAYIPKRDRTVTPILDVASGIVWVGAVAATPITALLRISDEGTGPPYAGHGYLRRDNANLDLFRDASFTQALTSEPDGSNRFSAEDLRSGVTLYLKGLVSGTTQLALSLEESKHEWLKIGDPVSRSVTIEAPLRIRLHNSKHEVMAGAWCKLSVSPSPLRSDAQGWVDVSTTSHPSEVHVEWGGASGDGPHPYSLDVRFDWDTLPENQQAAVRLSNLGYARASTEFEEAVMAFQYDYQVDHEPTPVGLEDGELPPDTRERLWAIYDAECNANTAVA